jgi:hypothetical protein
LPLYQLARSHTLRAACHGDGPFCSCGSTAGLGAALTVGAGRPGER